MHLKKENTPFCNKYTLPFSTRIALKELYKLLQTFAILFLPWNMPRINILCFQEKLDIINTYLECILLELIPVWKDTEIICTLSWFFPSRRMVYLLCCCAVYYIALLDFDTWSYLFLRFQTYVCIKSIYNFSAAEFQNAMYSWVLDSLWKVVYFE